MSFLEVFGKWHDPMYGSTGSESPNPWIPSAMAMAMSIYRTLCVLVSFTFDPSAGGGCHIFYRRFFSWFFFHLRYNCRRWLRPTSTCTSTTTTGLSRTTSALWSWRRRSGPTKAKLARFSHFLKNFPSAEAHWGIESSIDLNRGDIQLFKSIFIYSGLLLQYQLYSLEKASQIFLWEASVECKIFHF